MIRNFVGVKMNMTMPLCTEEVLGRLGNDEQWVLTIVWLG